MIHYQIKTLAARSRLAKKGTKAMKISTVFPLILSLTCLPKALTINHKILIISFPLLWLASHGVVGQSLRGRGDGNNITALISSTKPSPIRSGGGDRREREKESKGCCCLWKLAGGGETGKFSISKLKVEKGPH